MNLVTGPLRKRYEKLGCKEVSHSFLEQQLKSIEILGSKKDGRNKRRRILEVKVRWAKRARNAVIPVEQVKGGGWALLEF